MKKNKTFRSLARKYKKLPPEYKIPYALFLFIVMLALRLIELLKSFNNNLILLLKAVSQKIQEAFISTKTILQRIRYSFPKRKKKRRILKKNIILIPLRSKLKYFFFGTIFSFIFIFLPLASLIFLQDLPNPADLSVNRMQQTTKIYDRNKVLLYEIYADENRTIVPLEDIPKYLRDATLAIEDKNFYKHPGFDITSMIRALKENLSKGQPLQGGSTITQQLIKSSFFTSEKKLSRKIKEIALAFWAEHIYTKNQILEMYFNQVPYGGTAWGVEAASEVYFGKHVKQLSLAESAFLAGLTQAPSTYSPYIPGSTVWKTRQKKVLNNMVELGYITARQAKAASSEKLEFRQPKEPLLAPHFVMYVKDLLIQRHGLAAVEKVA